MRNARRQRSSRFQLGLMFHGLGAWSSAEKDDADEQADRKCEEADEDAQHPQVPVQPADGLEGVRAELHNYYLDDEGGKQNNHEDVVLQDPAEDVQSPVGPAHVDLVAEIEHHESVKHRSPDRVAKRLVPLRAARGQIRHEVCKKRRPGVQEDQGRSAQHNGLPEDHAPHVPGDERLLLVVDRRL
ncbi:MAG: hypothetical protein BJ554DRAFT_8176 [Olpidium bornovanus]|uniref:Uncharacterized protein n=1 Tax=Olpidium bornovanus TaxID=278681 RepID=A0A8H7ZUF3_9FUNG|nr:MAG: hypothetical protein BJ554DRAFT_8176 [Olpidium bornovanus]